MHDPACDLCRQTETLAHDPAAHGRLIHEFPHSYLCVGPHQRFEGYCVLVAKTHAREPFELPQPAREGMLTELMRCAQAISEAFRPWKINYACYGNQVPHVHWHLFPRYESDPLRNEVPWAQAAEFAAAATSADQARAVIARVRKALGLPG